MYPTICHLFISPALLGGRKEGGDPSHYFWTLIHKAEVVIRFEDEVGRFDTMSLQRLSLIPILTPPTYISHTSLIISSLLSPHHSHLHPYSHLTTHTFILTLTSPLTPSSLLSPHHSHLHPYSHLTTHTFILTLTSSLTPSSLLSPHHSHLHLYSHLTTHTFILTLTSLMTPLTSLIFTPLTSSHLLHLHS